MPKVTLSNASQGRVGSMVEQSNSEILGSNFGRSIAKRIQNITSVGLLLQVIFNLKQLGYVLVYKMKNRSEEHLSGKEDGSRP